MRVPKIGEIRKALVNIAGLATSIVTIGFIHGQALVITNTVIAILTAIAHYTIVNDPTPEV